MKAEKLIQGKWVGINCSYLVFFALLLLSKDLNDYVRDLIKIVSLVAVWLLGSGYIVSGNYILIVWLRNKNELQC